MKPLDPTKLDQTKNLEPSKFRFGAPCGQNIFFSNFGNFKNSDFKLSCQASVKPFILEITCDCKSERFCIVDTKENMPILAGTIYHSLIFA